MIQNFFEIEKQRKKENFEWLNSNSGVFEWFLIQSIVNKKDITKLKSEFAIPNNFKTIKSICEYLYNQATSEEFVNKIINYIYKQSKIDDLFEIQKELQQIKSFSWGGDFQGSLEKSLIKKYVKNNISINQNIEEITKETINYLYASKYNYLSSKLTENIFFKHAKVIPTINKIKSVDFFIDTNFWDLKQTILPKAYIDKRNIAEVITEIENNPSILIKWLYENQGEMRFGSENRIFIIFVDIKNYSESWKLKSDLFLLSDKINSFLDSKQSPLSISFNFKGREYRCKSNLIMIAK